MNTSFPTHFAPLRACLSVFLLGTNACGVPTIPSTTDKPDSGDAGEDGGISAGADGGEEGADGAGTDEGADGGSNPPRCSIRVELPTLYYWEGDTVAGNLGCDLGEESEWTFDLGGPAADSSPDAEGGFVWVTDGTDGGRLEIIASAHHPELDFPETTTITIWVADNPDAPGAEEPDPMLYQEEWGLPVIHIDPEAPISEGGVEAEIVVYGQVFAGDAQIRGAASAWYPKPSLTLGFGDGELELPSFSENNLDHIVLLSNFDDNSHLRQRLVYAQWARVAADLGGPRLAPRAAPVVVYKRGQYEGLFLALDRPDNDFIRHMGFEEGGDLYKAVSHDANFYLTDASGNTKGWLGAGYEKREGADESDWSSLEALVAFTGGASDRRLIDEAENWFELEEFVDWLILVTFCLGEDSAGKNSYLYQDPTDGRFFFGPWDFNHAYGQNWYTARTDAETDNEYIWNNRVFLAIQNDPEWSETIRNRYAELSAAGGPYDPTWIHAQLETWEAELEPHVARDWETWQRDYRNYGGWDWARGSDWTTAEEEQAYLHEWIDSRADHLRSWSP